MTRVRGPGGVRWFLGALMASAFVAGCTRPMTDETAVKSPAPRVMVAANPLGPPVTDDDVREAVEKGREWLIGQQQPDGSWPKGDPADPAREVDNSLLAYYTLAWLGGPPSREYMGKALDAIMRLDLTSTAAVSLRVRGLASIYNRLLGDKRGNVRVLLIRDVLRLAEAQGPQGGWGAKSVSDRNVLCDLRQTAMAIQALHAAIWVGIEVPIDVLKRAQSLFFMRQQQDGSWKLTNLAKDPTLDDRPSYGSDTADGVSSLYIAWDMLAADDPGSFHGSPATPMDIERRLDQAMHWLCCNFRIDADPQTGGIDPRFRPSSAFYGLYAAERAAMASGYKYFGNKDWFRDGAAWLVRNQKADGSWGSLPDTCYAMLFLFNGRAPVLFNKLKFDGLWNARRRDIANLTQFIEHIKEQMFQWQIVDLRSPLEELHDAPILYISAESPPRLFGSAGPGFSDEEKKKLRAFTDTGGTILIHTPRDNPAVMKWFSNFAKEAWPEWKLKPLGAKHPVFNNPYPIREPIRASGIDDGVRTFLFQLYNDAPWAWQQRAVVSGQKYYQFASNLDAYARDGGPWRLRLPRRASEPDRYTSPVGAGAKIALRIARLKYDGDWSIGRHYRGFDRVADEVKKRTGLVLTVEEEGVVPADLAGFDGAYLAAAPGMALGEAERAALKAWLARGGLVWIEAVAGRPEAGEAVKKLAAEAEWVLKPFARRYSPHAEALAFFGGDGTKAGPLLKDDTVEGDPIMTGRFAEAAGYDLASGVRFRRTLRVARLGRGNAELVGIYQGEKLVGVYSPFDAVFSTTGYDAYGNRGYLAEDAQAVATNIVLFLTDSPAAK